VRTVFEKCASWKIPTIPSKMRTLFQGAHLKLRTFAEWRPEAALKDTDPQISPIPQIFELKSA
jgi:hypothetical protein